MDKSETDLIRSTAPGTATAPPAPAPSAASPSHLVDVTMFWSPVGGGVGRYLRSKQAWVDGARAGVAPYAAGARRPRARPRGVAARHACRSAPGIASPQPPRRPSAPGAVAAGRDRGGRPVSRSRGRRSTPAGGSASRWPRSPIRMSPSWRGAPAAGWPRAPRALYLRRLYRQFDAVFAASQWMVGELRELGVDRVVHQPLGVDCAVPSSRAAAANGGARASACRRAIACWCTRVASRPRRTCRCSPTPSAGSAPHHALVAIGDGPAAPQGPRVIRLPYQSDAARAGDRTRQRGPLRARRRPGNVRARRHSSRWRAARR